MPAKPSTAQPRRKASETKQLIIDAAIDCFERDGSQKISMAEIAELAGVSRKTLYRLFEDRSALIEDILTQRIGILGSKVRKRLAGYTGFVEALVEGSIFSVDAGRSDHLINELVQRESNHRMELFLIRGTDDIQSDMRDTWASVIEMGRRENRVRADLTDARIIEIIISIHALLLMRDDYQPDHQRAFLRDVLVPAITGGTDSTD